MCACSEEVQDEEHVLLECPLTEHIRQEYSHLNYSGMTALLNNEMFLLDLCKVIYKIEKLFKEGTNFAE